MSVYKNKNRFFSNIIILLSFFILVLVTKDKIVVAQENIDLKETYNLELLEKKDTLTELKNLSNKLSNSGVDTNTYYIDIKEDELIDYIYSYIEKTNTSEGITIIKSLSISEPKSTEIGFNETIINLNLMVENEKKLKKILDFLTSSKSKYNFFISSFSYSYGSFEGGKNISIPLRILHK